MKLTALFAIVAMAVSAIAQTNTKSLGFDSIKLSFEQPRQNLGDRVFTSWRFDNSHDLVWLKPNQLWLYDRDETVEPIRSDRFRYRPDLAFGIDDGLFGFSVIHGSTWSGRTQPRYAQFNLFGIIPLGRIRVNRNGW